MSAEAVGQVWRREAPHVLTALLRRHGDLGDCEDAAQEAAEAAAVQWTRDGLPDNPRGWLVRVASRRLIDRQRADRTRADREVAVARARPADDDLAPPPDADPSAAGEDTLRLFLLCCHPSLSRPSQVALTLHAVAGLTTAEIAAAYLVPERTMAQRLSRARAGLRSAGATFVLPGVRELPARITAVLDVCHLMFTEGHTRTGGTALLDPGLAGEAIRLTRQLHALVPDHDEVAGALALMLLTHARAGTRSDRGELVPLAEQDRTRWDRALIAEGVRILETVLPRGHVGRYQLQAAIAAVHAEAPTWESTDWTQICVLYAMLSRIAPSPAVTLNRAVALAMAFGPDQGLTHIGPLVEDPAMRRHHRTHAVRAHLLEMSGDHAAALASYAEAARLTTSLPEQRYLNERMRRLGEGSAGAAG
ncbi:sigma-70 family RNA polymerase sigma factor [Nocardia cyriacigeorgica]|uniref:RNA polymerase sigma factor n=1 Tax=Nocardia cyriacigeorgica TaxID=135487 RepID=UPI001893F258|nr:sigma-70 family RNA polymerase sigma factor [Nocardia cyriacigeorgica]MBF6320449.1 sigma-70 family RNA polymerase sigma factor [Nocardia cyriacigeorgica]MBF6534936.1 sigma-70 family RNA polymerase sigma factor [Nocardia cyriacigeorgica]